MAEVCSLPAPQVMLTAPFPGTQQVYVDIKQVVALCSQTPFKCSIAASPERVRVVHAASTNQEAFLKEPYSFGSFLKELWPPTNRAHLGKKMWLQRRFAKLWLCLEFLFKLSQILCGCSQPMLAHQCVSKNY